MTKDDKLTQIVSGFFLTGYFPDDWAVMTDAQLATLCEEQCLDELENVDPEFISNLIQEMGWLLYRVHQRRLW